MKRIILLIIALILTLLVVYYHRLPKSGGSRHVQKHRAEMPRRH